MMMNAMTNRITHDNMQNWWIWRRNAPKNVKKFFAVYQTNSTPLRMFCQYFGQICIKKLT